MLASAYAVAGVVWILCSDSIAEALARDTAELARFQTWKGWIFVIGSAGLVYALIRAAQARFAVAQRALRASEERYRLALSGAHAGVWDYDLTANGDGAGNPWNARLHPEDRALLLGEAAALVQGGREHIELDLRTAESDGSSSIIRVRAALLTDAEGSPIRLVGTFADITAIRRAEEDHAERTALQERVATLAASVPGALFSLELRPGGAMRVPYASATVQELFGVSPEVFSENGQELLRWVLKEDRQRVRAAMAVCIQELSPCRCVFRVQHPTRGQLWLEVGATPLLTSEGGHVWHGYAQDVSERKRQEAALEESGARFRSYIEHSPIAILLADAEGRLLDANSAAVRLLGLPSSLGGIQLRDVAAETAAVEGFSRALRIGVDEGEYRMRRHGEEEFWAYVRAVAVPGQRLLLYVEDTTARVRAELLLRTRIRLSAVARGWDVVQLVQEALDAAEAATGSKSGFVCFLEWEGSSTEHWIWSKQTVERSDGDAPASFGAPPPSWRAAIESTTPQVLSAPDPSAAAGHVPLLLVPLVQDGRAVAVLGVRGAKGGYGDDEIRSSGEIGAMLLDFVRIIANERALDESRRNLERLVEARTTALEAARQYIRLILDSTADGIFGVDATGMITFGNPAAAAFLGRERLEDTSVLRDVHPTDATGAPFGPGGGPLEQALREGRDLWSDTEVFLRADGRMFPVEFSFRPMERDGERLGGVVCFRDVTERRRAVQILNQSLADAERLASARRNFLATMSHEIRTPLNAVLGYTKVARRASRGHPVSAYLAPISLAGKHLLGVVDDILDYFKIEAEKLDIVSSTIDPAQVLDQAVALVAGAAATRGISLTVDEAPDLPRAWEGDAQRLRQVLVNLLGNAIKFTPRGGRVALAVWCAASSPRQLVLRVADSGIGMSEEQLARLFRPFVQADSSITRRYGGSGLGLSISRHLVLRMGGELHVESREGEGSVFEVRLPLGSEPPPTDARFEGLSVGLLGFGGQEAAAMSAAFWARGAAPTLLQPGDALPQGLHFLLLDEKLLVSASALVARARLAGVRVAVLGSSVAGRPEAGPDVWLDRPFRPRHLLEPVSSADADADADGGPLLQGVRVLAAEDNEANRGVLDALLRVEGASLVCVESGAAALAELENRGRAAFDIVLTDISMPDMDGYETTRRIHALFPDLPVVGVTAHVMPEERERCLQSGMVDHLPKPIEPRMLAEVVRRHAHPVIANAAPEALVDWVAVEAMLSGDKVMIARLVSAALSSQRGAPDVLRDAVARQDLGALQFKAHNLRGMAANFRANSTATLAADVENSARLGRADAEQLGLALAAQTERLLEELATRATPAAN
jgi:PAS domain S-box-containing protein